jgi:hypothetical protein
MELKEKKTVKGPPLQATCLSLAALVLAGCTFFPRHAVHEARGDPEAERLNHGYALLFELMDQESGASRIFILKDASEETKSLVRAVSAVSREARKRLEAFDEADPMLHMDRKALPETEEETRGAIGWATTKELLFGEDHDRTRKGWLKNLGNAFEELNRLITARLAVKR